MSHGHILLKAQQTRLGYFHDYVFGTLLIALAVFVSWHYSWALGGTLSIALTTVACIMLLHVEIAIRSHTLEVETDKVLLSEGIFTRTHVAAAFQNISDLHTHQDFHERIMGFGTLQINTSGGRHSLEFHKLRHPQKMRNYLLELAHQHAMRVSGGNNEPINAHHA